MILRRIVFPGIFLLLVSAMVLGQDEGAAPAGEMTIEQMFLQESIEMMIIREQVRSSSRDMKMVALEYIEEALVRGNRSNEIHTSLDLLAMEGIVNRTTENGRLMNNFPDVRVRAATLLGDLGTPEAKDSLIRMVLADNESMVITEAIKSLAKIGLNDNDETINAITWTVARYDAFRPDNLLALSAIDAYERIAQQQGGIRDPGVIQILMRIAEGPYIRPVQNRAREVLMELRRLAMFEN
ncbi:MAG: HEAT repeat domain-containing protein [Treponema sp.]|nr:HEAT repeat domain-containing protein [Treponema sp.]